MKKIFAIILFSAICASTQEWRINEFIIEGDSLFKIEYTTDSWHGGDTGMINRKRVYTYKGNNIRLTKIKDRRFRWKPAKMVEDTIP
jgi:hypothetical protein